MSCLSCLLHLQVRICCVPAYTCMCDLEYHKDEGNLKRAEFGYQLIILSGVFQPTFFFLLLRVIIKLLFRILGAYHTGLSF